MMTRTIKYPKNLYVAKIDGLTVVIKATFEDIEREFRNNPNMSDYKPLRVIELKGGKV